jgi:DNA-binding transcriptional MerR regulator
VFYIKNRGADKNGDWGILKETSISIDTLRYYNKIGLLEPKRLNNIRKYHEDDLQKAIAIIKLKMLVLL